MAKQVILFRYSPRTVGLNYADSENSVILAPIQNKEKFRIFREEWGYQLPEVRFLSDYSLKSFFNEILKLSEKDEITKVTTLSEEDVEEAGLLNAFFTKEPSSLLSSILFKDKYYMRTFLQGFIPQPEFELITSQEQLNRFICSVESEKFVIKPRSKAGAQDVFIVQKGGELPSLEEVPLFSGQFLIETYVPLEKMITCDGYAIKNKIQRFFVHEYQDLILPSIENNSDLLLRTSQLYSENQFIIEKAQTLSKKVLDLFCPIVEIVPFHFEWFYSLESEEFVFCEVGKRFGGGNIPSLIKHSFDIDVLKEYWAIQNGEGSLEELYEADEQALLFPRMISTYYSLYKQEGYLIETPAESMDWTENFWLFSKPNQETKASQNITEVHYIAVFTSSDEEEFQENIQKLKTYNEGFVYKVE